MPRTHRLPLVTALALLACTPIPSDTSATVGDTESGTDTDTSDTTASSSTTSTTTSATTSTTTTATTTTTTSTTASTDTTQTTDMTTMGTTSADPVCGDGKVEGSEECDNGQDNADDAACTSACKSASCGDGLVFTGMESCDDGVNDGAYGGCNGDCTLAPYCGDGETQRQEECDSSNPSAGCLSTCRVAHSCLELKNEYPEASSGVYTLHPEGIDPMVDVYCDMDTDGGGYTFLKVNSSKLRLATEAEANCANYGMRLFVPRTAAHAASAYTVATTDTIAAVGDGTLTASPKFLGILGIYPAVAGQSCPGMPFNSAECSEWQANDQGAFFVTDEGQADEPSIKNCAGCSLYYDWTGAMAVTYLASNVKGGGSSLAYICHVGDK